MYIVDYGVVKIDMSIEGKPPYVFETGTGAVGRVSRRDG